MLAKNRRKLLKLFTYTPFLYLFPISIKVESAVIEYILLMAKKDPSIRLLGERYLNTPNIHYTYEQLYHKLRDHIGSDISAEKDVPTIILEHVSSDFKNGFVAMSWACS